MRRPSGDGGSVLLLVLGLTVVLVALVGVVADVSVLLLAKRGVASAADGAAVAGAQQLDREALYGDGLGQELPLDPAGVASAVSAYERTVEPRTALDASVQGPAVRVRAARRVPLPFGRWAGVGSVTVRAVATARAPVRR